MTEAPSRLPRAAMWNLVDIVGRQTIQLAFAVLLARILTPSDFGVVAIAMLLVVFGSALSEGGVSVALVQRQFIDDNDRAACIITNAGLGAMATAAVMGIAGPVADIYDRPQLEPLLLLMAPSIFFSAMGATPLALLTRDLEFRSIATAGVASTVVSGAVAASLALSGAGVYALGAQPLVATAVYALVLNLRRRAWPAAIPPRSSFTRLWSFGGYILIATLLEVAFSRMYAGLVGRTEGIRGVGLYARADQTQQLVSNVMGSLINRVSLPVLSRHDPKSDAMTSSLRRGCVLLMGLNAPLIGLLGALATPVVTTVFGEQWSDSGPILSVLCLAAIYFPLQVVNVSFVVAAGRPKLYLLLEIAKKLVGLPLIVVGSLFGAIWVAAAYVVYAGIALFLNSLPARSMTGYGLMSQLRDTSGGVVITVPVCVGLHLIANRWSPPAIVESTVLGTVGVLLIAGAYACFRPACARPLWDACVAVAGRNSR